MFLNFGIVGPNPAVEICGKYSLVGRKQSTIMRPESRPYPSVGNRVLRLTQQTAISKLKTILLLKLLLLLFSSVIFDYFQEILNIIMNIWVDE